MLSAVIEFAFGELARQPWRVGKPLRREWAGNFSARRGPYRLLYRIEQNVVFIVCVEHRGDVYRHPLPS